MGSVTHPERARRYRRHGGRSCFGDDFVDNNCVCTSLINANSPMVFDATMLGALKTYARAGPGDGGEPLHPGRRHGARDRRRCDGPERWPRRLAGIAVTPGCAGRARPVIFGSFSSSISMLSGAPTFGTPEPALAPVRPWRRWRAGSTCPSATAARSAPRNCRMRRLPTRGANHADADRAGRGEFRAPRRRLAGGRAVFQLREADHGRRPARHAPGHGRGATT